MFLSCIGTVPKEAVYFQLLIQNQHDEEKTVCQGGQKHTLLTQLPTLDCLH